MKIVNPNLATNEIKLIPRLDVSSTLNLELINEGTKDTFNKIIFAYTYLNGILSFDLEHDFNEGESYSFKFYRFNFGSSDTIFYRGNIFATTQEAQDYQLTKDLYFYEP